MKILPFMNTIPNDKLFYAIFQTRWGFFGLAGRQNALLRTVLPASNEKIIENLLLKGVKDALPNKKFCQNLQQKIQAFFEGNPADFNDIVIDINQFNHFTKDVLTACRAITFAQTISYSQLAEIIGNRLAARAVGRALAQNPLPLIIPCHRIIRSDKLPGGFSATGGTKLKARLLELESNCLAVAVPATALFSPRIYSGVAEPSAFGGLGRG
jgi:O-6-methylguanine DNA methyltransferase